MNKPTKNGKMQVSIDNDNSLFIYTHDDHYALSII